MYTYKHIYIYIYIHVKTIELDVLRMSTMRTSSTSCGNAHKYSLTFILNSQFHGEPTFQIIYLLRQERLPRALPPAAVVRLEYLAFDVQEILRSQLYYYCIKSIGGRADF